MSDIPAVIVCLGSALGFLPRGCLSEGPLRVCVFSAVQCYKCEWSPFMDLCACESKWNFFTFIGFYTYRIYFMFLKSERVWKFVFHRSLFSISRFYSALGMWILYYSFIFSSWYCKLGICIDAFSVWQLRFHNLYFRHIEITWYDFSVYLGKKNINCISSQARMPKFWHIWKINFSHIHIRWLYIPV